MLVRQKHGKKNMERLYATGDIKIFEEFWFYDKAENRVTVSYDLCDLISWYHEKNNKDIHPQKFGPGSNCFSYNMALHARNSFVVIFMEVSGDEELASYCIFNASKELKLASLEKDPKEKEEINDA